MSVSAGTHIPPLRLQPKRRATFSFFCLQRCIARKSSCLLTRCFTLFHTDSVLFFLFRDLFMVYGTPLIDYGTQKARSNSRESESRRRIACWCAQVAAQADAVDEVEERGACFCCCCVAVW